MIASSRKSTLNPPVTRHFEFTRLQAQLTALAYQSLIPIISCPTKSKGARLGHNHSTATRRFQSKVGGA